MSIADLLLAGSTRMDYANRHVSSSGFNGMGSLSFLKAGVGRVDAYPTADLGSHSKRWPLT